MTKGILSIMSKITFIYFLFNFFNVYLVDIGQRQVAFQLDCRKKKWKRKKLNNSKTALGKLIPKAEVRISENAPSLHIKPKVSRLIANQ